MWVRTVRNCHARNAIPPFNGRCVSSAFARLSVHAAASAVLSRMMSFGFLVARLYVLPSPRFLRYSTTFHLRLFVAQLTTTTPSSICSVRAIGITHCLHLILPRGYAAVLLLLSGGYQDYQLNNLYADLW